MILECSSCAKMYRVRDDASPQPTKCPTCNGDLRAAGGAAQAANPTRVRELETKIQSLERELAESRTRPTLSVETSPGVSGFSAPVAELRSAAEKADRLERELLSLRSEMERKLKDKDREIAQARETADRESAERRKQEARASGLEDTHARSIEGKEKMLESLDASIASYRAKVETLQKKLDAVEIQRLNDLNAFDTRLREREQSDRAQLDRATEAQQQALEGLRRETEIKIAEKDRLISDGRQSLDREAGERRRLTETLNRLQENADRSVAEKQTSIAALEATLASYKTKIETLQNRVDSLEQMRRSEHDQLGKQVRASQSIRTRVDEASHLAVDLDHNLDAIEASIATIRDRSQRLKQSLEETGSQADSVAPLSALAPSFAPAPEPEAESAPPVLSQADAWGAPASAADVEEVLEAEPLEPVDEPPAFSDVEQTTIKPAPAQDPEPVEEPRVLENRAEPAPEMELLPAEPLGRSKEPTGITPVLEPAPAPEAAPAPDETAYDIPLISPPEEDRPAPAPPPPAAKKEETKRKFSWQRK